MRTAQTLTVRASLPEARDGSDFRDDFDLHPANSLENDRELALFHRLSAIPRFRSARG